MDDWQHAGTGGGNDRNATVARLESGVSHIRLDLGETKADVRGIRTEARSDFRLMFGALIAATLGLAALMARGFGWL